MRYIYIYFLFLFLSFPTLAQKKDKSTAAGNIYVSVEEMPEFPGGNDSLAHFIQENYILPRYAWSTDSTVTAYINFIADYFGYVQHVENLNRVHPLIDQSAVQVIKSLPQWKPGKQDGETVSVKYTIPIRVPAPRYVPSFLQGTSPFPTYTYDEEAYEKDVFLSVQVNPKFPKGDKAFNRFIKHNYKVPVAAQKLNGIAKFSFIITPEGKVTRVKALSNLGSDVEETMIEMLNQMPDWKPGTNQGKPQFVKRTVEIRIENESASFKEIVPSTFDRSDL